MYLLQKKYAPNGAYWKIQKDFSSLIQTLLSVQELHLIMQTLADYTAGMEFHQTPK
jgi:hypothetical protein